VDHRDLDKRIHHLETRIAYLSADLAMLRALISRDDQSALNKIRYVTEKVLHRLCRESEISWGKGEPTVENMIGPLIARGVIPRNIAIHVRTIQTNASPGSHFQESALSHTHVQVAQIALLEFIEWHYQQTDSVAGMASEREPPAEPLRQEPPAALPARVPEPESLPTVEPPPRHRRRATQLAILVVAGICLAVALYVTLGPAGRRAPSEVTGIVLGVALDGPDTSVARWVLERRLAPVAEAVGAAQSGMRGSSEVLLLDGMVELGGRVRWLGARGAGGTIARQAREAALDAARSQVVTVLSLPWEGGLTLRVGLQPPGQTAWSGITGTESLDGAPLANIEDWPEEERQALASALVATLPRAYFHGHYRFRADFGLRVGDTGAWEAVETLAIRPEAFETRSSEWFKALTWFETERWDLTSLPSPPASLIGRHVRISVLALGSGPIPDPPVPEIPTAFDNVRVRPPRLSVGPSDVQVVYSQASPAATVEFSRLVDAALPRIEACDMGLLASTGLTQASAPCRILLDENGAEVELTTFHDEHLQFIGGWADETGLEQRAAAERAVLDCVDSEIRDLEFPTVERLIIADLTLSISPTPGDTDTLVYPSQEAADQAIMARFLTRHLRFLRCQQGLETQESKLHGWYAEIDEGGNLTKFDPHHSGEPSPGLRTCTAQLTEGLRLPATGFRVVLDPFGIGPLGEPAEAASHEAPVAETTSGITSSSADDLDAAKACVIANKPSIKACYEGFLKRYPEARAHHRVWMEVTFDVMPNGRVRDITVHGEDRDYPRMADCIAQAASSWRFTPSDEGFELTYPFNFFAY